MATDTHSIFTATNINDILYQLKTVSNLQITGGSTYLKELPEKSLSIRNIPELSVIDKHERYIDFGPAVTLNSMVHIGSNFLPAVLYNAVCSMGNHAIRNMATIGGNIMAKNPRLTLLAPLIALDATLKFKSQKGVEIVPLAKFEKIPEDSVLVNIRVPTEDWNVAVFQRLGPSYKITDNSCSYCFLADTEKNLLINLRFCFTGPFILTSKELESKYLGTRLPLSNDTIKEFLKTAGEEFDKAQEGHTIEPILKHQFLNLIAHSLHELT